MELQVNGEVYEIKRAEQEDLEKVLDLVVNAARWLQSKNTTQWDYYLTNLEENTPEILDSIRSNSTYLVMDGEKTVATVTLENSLNEWDLEIWGKDAALSDAVYLHRLVVDRDYSGKGIGDLILEWAENFVKAKGKKRIRFDCLASNKGLNAFYQRRYPLKEIAHIYGQHSKYEVVLS